MSHMVSSSPGATLQTSLVHFLPLLGILPLQRQREKSTHTQPWCTYSTCFNNFRYWEIKVAVARSNVISRVLSSAYPPLPPLFQVYYLLTTIPSLYFQAGNSHTDFYAVIKFMHTKVDASWLQNTVQPSQLARLNCSLTSLHEAMPQWLLANRNGYYTWRH